MIRKLVKRILAAQGYGLRRVGPVPVNPYTTSLLTLMACKGSVRIALVGANDGSLNDPLIDFVRANPANTSVILVEPQEHLIPILRENYSFHPDKRIFHGAVGPPGRMTLFSVKQEYWSRLKPIPYARGWPLYRAPTGVTSSDRSHVRHFLQKYLNDGLNPDQAIGSFEVESLRLGELVERTGAASSIDVLQVDVEGFDDEVLYHSDLPDLQPMLIRYESANLSLSNGRKLRTFLSGLDYEILDLGSDDLAIKKVPPFGGRH